MKKTLTVLASCAALAACGQKENEVQKVDIAAPRAPVVASPVEEDALLGRMATKVDAQHFVQKGTKAVSAELIDWSAQSEKQFLRVQLVASTEDCVQSARNASTALHKLVTVRCVADESVMLAADCRDGLCKKIGASVATRVPAPQ